MLAEGGWIGAASLALRWPPEEDAWCSALSSAQRVTPGKGWPLLWHPAPRRAAISC